MSKPTSGDRKTKTKQERARKEEKRQSQREKSKHKNAALSGAKPEPVIKPEKKPVGRPVTRNVKETCKAVTVRLPLDLLKKYDETREVIGYDKTNYITRLIQADMDAHYEERKLKIKYIRGEISLNEYNHAERV